MRKQKREEDKMNEQDNNLQEKSEKVTQKKEKCDKDVIPIISCHVECVVLMSKVQK